MRGLLSVPRLLGMIGASAGGANILRQTVRVIFWGALAMGVTAGTGAIFGSVARSGARRAHVGFREQHLTEETATLISEFGRPRRVELCIAASWTFRKLL